jgi:methylmalonyl-CoA mutase, C-terminal domain
VRTGDKIRVLISKCGLDGHDRGARVVARSLRDAGFEVVYLGLFQSPQSIVEAAIQEDVDAIGVSSHNAAHMTIFPRILELLRESGASDILLTGGGIIPKDDVETLTKMGVGELFGPGSSLAEFADYIRQEVARRRRGAGDGTVLPSSKGAATIPACDSTKGSPPPSSSSS